MRPLPRPLLVAAALLAAAPAAAAGPRVAVVTLDAPPQLQFSGRSAADAFAKEAAAKGFDVLGPAAVEAKLGRAAYDALVNCGEDAGCLADKGRALGVDRIVAGRLAQLGTTYRVALVQADAKTGARLGGVEREIPVASRRLQRDVAGAAPGLLAGQDATGLLKVATDVDGAEVAIDDVAVGRTPLAHALRPGKHKVKVSKAGFAEAEPVWVEVPANGVVEHRPRIFPIPARDRPNASASEGHGTAVHVVR